MKNLSNSLNFNYKITYHYIRQKIVHRGMRYLCCKHAGTLQILSQHSKCLNLIDLPQNYYYHEAKEKGENERRTSQESNVEDANPPQQTNTHDNINRRYWLVHEDSSGPIYLKSTSYEDEKDANIKKKIGSLVDHTMQGTEKRMKNVQDIKDKYGDEAPYRAGYVLSLVQKSKTILNELFNVAVRHREEWKALAHLKILELIMHTNVDTTNLVKNLVEIHLKHMNVSSDDTKDQNKNRVILI